MNQSRNFTSLLNPSYLQNAQQNAATANAAAAAAAAAAAVSAAIANGTQLNSNSNSTTNNTRKREAESDGKQEKETKEERRKRRKTRWGGSEHDKTFIPGMPTVLPTNLTPEQEKAYLFQLQIEEISRKLRTGDLGIPLNPEERSPSPEPIYSSDGKRLNTREYRTRRKLEEERHNLIQKILKINPEFKPPPDYKPPIIRVHDKVMIPQEEHPDINFVGLLIGPRGNTLKSMEKETGAKIIIRGKGSVKEGKVGRKDGQPLPGEDEPLHAYITANNLDAVKKAVERIHEIIRQGVEVPEGQNDLRRNQLRELALLNGTLRENDGPRCTNCGASDHKSWLCPDKPNVTNNIVCSSCGGAGHIARDCRSKRPGQGGPAAAGMGGMGPGGDKAKIDEEYMSLMAELGEGPPPDRSKTGQPRQPNPNPNYPGLFDRQQAPRALMAAPAHPPPQMMQGGPMMPPPGMAPPPWSQGEVNNMNGMNMQWQPPVSMPPPPGVMQPPPPPPGSTSQPNIPPLMPWMAGNNQPPPPGQMPPTQIPPPGMGIPPWQQGQQGPMRPPPPGTAPPPGFPGWQPQQMGGWPPAAPVPPPPQQQTPAPPGIDLNTLPTLLAQPPPPPPPTRIEILCHGAWAKGWANFLFASFIMNPYQEKWCTVVSTFLFSKAIDTIIINICRILLCVSHFIGRKLPKLFFCLHCLSWIYLYVLFVPKFLWPENVEYTRAQIGLQLWFIAECLDSVWFRFLAYAKATHWLETCLFPLPTQETIELAEIQKRHRDSLKKLVNRTSKRAELWQTLFCAVAIKKKIKRIRQAKQSDSILVDNSTEEKLIATEETKEINKEQKDEIMKQYSQIENE